MFSVFGLRSPTTASRAVVLLSGYIAAVFVVIVVAAAFYTSTSYVGSLDRRMAFAARTIAASAATPLWRLDQLGAHALLEGLRQEPDIISAEIVDERRDSFAAITTVTTTPARLVGYVEVPILAGAGTRHPVAGTLGLTYSRERVVVESNRVVMTIAVAGLVATLLSALLLSSVLRRFTVPLGEITAVMTAIEDGILNRVVPETGRLDEIGTLARSLDRTMTELRALNVSASKANHQLRVQIDRFDAALSNMSHGLCMLDGEERLIVCNRKFLEIFGIEADAAVPGERLRDIMTRASNRATCDVLPDGPAVREPRTFTEVLVDGRSVSATLQPAADGGWVNIYEDVTERRRVEERIAHMAMHDALTDLPNRLLFRERAELALCDPRAETSPVAVLCLDLDRFKAVNDTLGHPVGDALLRAVTERIKRSCGEEDTIARLGGDEFAVVQVGQPQPRAAKLLGEQLVAALGEPYDIHGHQVVIGTSVGIAIAPADGDDADELLKNADLALYRAKSDGRGLVRFFEIGLDARMRRRQELELDLRTALTEGQFMLHYQPLYELDSSRLTAFEALVRWNHPMRGLISPADFIPLAEETGLIRQIGAWVLRRACADAARWPDHVRVAVNLSPAQVADGHVVETVVSALAASGLQPSRLELEITETVLLQDNQKVLHTLHQLRGLGVRIAMDDFGTGYSSLSYLRSFPFDKIKIDRSFVQGLGSSADCAAIIRAVAGLGASLGMATTAEGVETEQQLDALRAEGCTEVQGFLLGRPMPIDQVEEILRLEKADSAAA